MNKKRATLSLVKNIKEPISISSKNLILNLFNTFTFKKIIKLKMSGHNLIKKLPNFFSSLKNPVIKKF